MSTGGGIHPPRNVGWIKSEKNISLKIMEHKIQTTYYFSGLLEMGSASPRPRSHSSRTVDTSGHWRFLIPAVTSMGWGHGLSPKQFLWVAEELKQPKDHSQRQFGYNQWVLAGKRITDHIFTQLQCQRLVLSISVPARGRELVERIFDNISKIKYFHDFMVFNFSDALQYQF